MNRGYQNHLINYAINNIKPFNPFCNQETIVYAHLIEEPMDMEEMEDSNLFLYFELFTEISIQSDYDYFTNNRTDDYIPYSYTLSITRDQSSNKNEALSELQREIHNNNGWVKGKISNDPNDGIPGHISLAFGLVNKEHNNQKLPLELDATFIPIRLSVDDQNYTKLQATIETNERLLRETEYIPTELPSSDSQGSSDGPSNPYNVKIYKVGAGNTITIEKDDHCILFDCGQNSPPDRSVINDIIDNVKHNIIIISHWHTDHYILLPDIDCSRVSHIIIPNLNINHKTYVVSINNLLASLKKRGVQIIDLSKLRNYKNLLQSLGYPNIDIFLGEQRPDPGKGSPLGHIDYPRSDDDCGIILSIKEHIGNRRAILPGDCSYYSWPDEAELDLTNTIKLVLPHHGGHVVSKKINGIFSSLYATVYLSTNFGILTNRIEKKSQTYHYTFVNTVLNRPYINITKNHTGKYFSFTI